MLPDTTNSSAALLRMSQGRLSYLRRILPAFTNQSEDCLYLNVYLPVQGTVYLPLSQRLPACTRYCLVSTCLYLNVYLPVQGTVYLPLSQRLPACTRFCLPATASMYLPVHCTLYMYWISLSSCKGYSLTTCTG